MNKFEAVETGGRMISASHANKIRRQGLNVPGELGR